MTIDRASRLLAGLLLAGSVAMVVTTLYGAYLWYSPVPFWDMWDGYVLAYINSQRHGLAVEAVRQANEHRDILSRILFWFDLEFFGGLSRLLIPVNIALLVGLWLALCAAARHLIAGIALRRVVYLTAAALCFSWLQRENIVVGYQSQFFLASLVPLLAFEALAMGWFVTALVLMVASLGTMANGLLVPPLCVAMLLLGGDRKRAIVAAAVGAAAIGAWFIQYTFIAHPPSPLPDVVTFVLTFLGSPFGAVADSETLGIVAGLIFIAAALGLFAAWWRDDAPRPAMQLALFAFIAFVGASALITGIGRAGATPNAALVSRYATPALMAWGALAVLLAARARPSPTLAAWIGLLAILGLSSAQWNAVNGEGRLVANDRNRAGLAIVLGIPDSETLGAVYPVERGAYFKTVTDFAAAFHVSIFADDSPFTVAARRLGTASGFHPCGGNIEDVKAIEGSDAFRVAGWVFDRDEGETPPFAYLARGGLIAGVLVTGLPRADVAEVIGRKAGNAGFTGYLEAPVSGATLVCLD
jgi:hypothetical protein